MSSSKRSIDPNGSAPLSSEVFWENSGLAEDIRLDCLCPQCAILQINAWNGQISSNNYFIWPQPPELGQCPRIKLNFYSGMKIFVNQKSTQEFRVSSLEAKGYHSMASKKVSSQKSGQILKGSFLVRPIPAREGNTN